MFNLYSEITNLSLYKHCKFVSVVIFMDVLSILNRQKVVISDLVFSCSYNYFSTLFNKYCHLQLFMQSMCSQNFLKYVLSKVLRCTNLIRILFLDFLGKYLRSFFVRMFWKSQCSTKLCYEKSYVKSSLRNL